MSIIRSLLKLYYIHTIEEHAAILKNDLVSVYTKLERRPQHIRWKKQNDRT